MRDKLIQLQVSDAAKDQVVFATTTSLLDLPLVVQENVLRKLDLPRYLLEQIYLESNGFAGHHVRHDRREQPHSYTHWCRFIVKQTFENLTPKKIFTPYVPRSDEKGGDTSAHRGLHGPHTIQHGWEWHEMWFFTRWEASGARTCVCFDLPSRTLGYIKARLADSDAQDLRHCSSPYSILAIAVEGVARSYDDSVWSIRNQISRREARRAHEVVDYAVLHEIARHSTHVAESLTVATRTVDTICAQYSRSRSFLNSLSSDSGKAFEAWDDIGDKLSFQLRVLQGLTDRSFATDTRIQNEITLAFHVATQSDTKIHVQIGSDAAKEAAAMRAIAVVTMTFLPATFVSTLFGMGFFTTQPSGDGTNGTLILSSDFWIFWAVSVPLTVITLISWWWWHRRRLRVEGDQTNERVLLREV